MARRLTESEFFHLISKKVGTTDKVAKECWNATVDTIISELQMYQMIYLPYFGVLRARPKGGGYVTMNDISNKDNPRELKEVWIDPYYSVHLSTTDGFKEQLKGDKMTRYQRDKLRKLIKKEELLNIEKERQRKIVEGLDDTIANITNKRLTAIAKNKSKLKMTKKKREDMEFYENYDEYDFHSEEEIARYERIKGENNDI